MSSSPKRPLCTADKWLWSNKLASFLDQHRHTQGPVNVIVTVVRMFVQWPPIHSTPPTMWLTSCLACQLIQFHRVWPDKKRGEREKMKSMKFFEDLTEKIRNFLGGVWGRWRFLNSSSFFFTSFPFGLSDTAATVPMAVRKKLMIDPFFLLHHLLLHFAPFYLIWRSF